MGPQYASPAAIHLMTGTVLAESNATYLRQITNKGYGPARGFWQMEPATHEDCWENWLCFPKQSKVANAILALIGNLPASADLMTTNLAYACALCRIKYFRAPASLPSAGNAIALSLYHKRYYNSALGKADPLKNIPLFQKAINA